MRLFYTPVANMCVQAGDEQVGFGLFPPAKGTFQIFFCHISR
jgi:hypothetical protein